VSSKDYARDGQLEQDQQCGGQPLSKTAMRSKLRERKPHPLISTFPSSVD
jgi:hypothetical protein